MKMINGKLIRFIITALGSAVLGLALGKAYYWLLPPMHKFESIIHLEDSKSGKPLTEEYVLSCAENKVQLRPMRVRILHEINRLEHSRLKPSVYIKPHEITMIEALVIEDYSSPIKAESHEKIRFKQLGTYEWQYKGDPILTAGQEYVVLAYKNNIKNDFWELSHHTTFDLVQTPDGEVLYKRGVAFSVPGVQYHDRIPKPVESTPENPAEYSQVVRLDDLLKLLYDKGWVNEVWIKDDRLDQIKFWIGAVSIFVTILGSLVIASRIRLRRRVKGVYQHEKDQ